MRKLILSMQMSLDGFIEGPKGEMDWFAHDNAELWGEFFRTIAKVDTVLMGRGMASGYAAYWGAVLAEPGKHSKNEVKYARFAEKTRHIVYSRSMKKADWPNTTVNAGDLETEVQKLKQSKGGDLAVFGGAIFASALVERGLVDLYRIIVNPVVLGGGKALFKEVSRRRRLKLMRTKAFRSGAVLVRYKNA